MRKGFDKKELKSALSDFVEKTAPNFRSWLPQLLTMVHGTPGKILDNGVCYGEVYGENSGAHFDYRGVLFFACRESNDIECMVIGHDAEFNVWTNFHEIALYGMFVETVNAAMYGKYDTQHSTEVALEQFMFEYDVLLLENEKWQVLANKIGFEIAQIGIEENRKVYHYDVVFPYDMFEIQHIQPLYDIIQTRIARIKEVVKQSPKQAIELHDATEDETVKWFFNEVMSFGDKSVSIEQKYKADKYKGKAII